MGLRAFRTSVLVLTYPHTHLLEEKYSTNAYFPNKHAGLRAVLVAGGSRRSGCGFYYNRDVIRASIQLNSCSNEQLYIHLYTIHPFQHTPPAHPKKSIATGACGPSQNCTKTRTKTCTTFHVDMQDLQSYHKGTTKTERRKSNGKNVLVFKRRNGRYGSN